MDMSILTGVSAITVFAQGLLSSFPTTFMIMKNGEIFGLVPGAIPRVLVENIVQQTLDASL